MDIYRKTIENLTDKHNIPGDGKIVKDLVIKTEISNLDSMYFDVHQPDKVLIINHHPYSCPDALDTHKDYEIRCFEADKLSFVIHFILAMGGFLICDCDWLDMEPLTEVFFLSITRDAFKMLNQISDVLNEEDDYFVFNICDNEYAPEAKAIIGLLF